MKALNNQIGGSHYKNMKIQPMEYILKNELGFTEGCIVKYVSRYKFKNGIEDLKKAKQNLDILIEYLEENEHYTDKILKDLDRHCKK